MSAPNYRAIATEIGDAVKYASTVNEINRAALAVFKFRCENFPNDSITSVRARTVYNWILSLAKQSMRPEERDRLLGEFCRKIAPPDLEDSIEKILLDNGLSRTIASREQISEFRSRSYHRLIVEHCRNLFIQGNYFHAVFEACKVYNKLVKDKSRSQKDGHALMLDVWGWEKGVLKVTSCQTETDRNVQDGIKFLAAGMMHAIRNPTAHEPALEWPLERQECLDLLSFLSFLFRKVDTAVYYKA